MLRYIRAFFIALRMTIRGETVPPTSPHREIATWALEGARLVERLYAAAEQHGLDSATRQAIHMRIDGRNTSVEVILGTLRHHMRDEFPYLIRAHPASHMAAIQANIFNDQYRIERLQALPQFQAADLQTALVALRNHLEALPSV